MSPVQGFTRLRKHQIGRQSVVGTKVAATRVFPFSGVPSNNLNWTDPDIDVGSIVKVVKPTRGIPDLSFPFTVPQLDYNTLAALLCYFFGGNVSPTGGGTAKTWAHLPAAVAPLDPFDFGTYEWGDDVVTDWFQWGDGFIESLTITGPEGLGPCTASGTWRFGSIASTGSTDSPASGTVPTPGLTLDDDPPVVYLKDMGIYIADNTAGLSAGQILNALHTFELNLAQTFDAKRFANATQSFDVSDYGRTGFTAELNATFAKTSDTVGTGSESDAWLADEAVDRYIELKFESLKEAQSGVPFSWDNKMAARYYTRTEGEAGGNSVIVLNAQAFYDADDLGGFVDSTVVNTLTDADLGTITT